MTLRTRLERLGAQSAPAINLADAIRAARLRWIASGSRPFLDRPLSDFTPGTQAWRARQLDTTTEQPA